MGRIRGGRTGSAGVPPAADGVWRVSWEARAEGIVAEEMARRRWVKATLSLRRKGDAEKVKIAVRLRRETTVTLAWIAERLQMGSKTHVAHLL